MFYERSTNFTTTGYRAVLLVIVIEKYKIRELRKIESVCLCAFGKILLNDYCCLKCVC